MSFPEWASYRPIVGKVRKIVIRTRIFCGAYSIPAVMPRNIHVKDEEIDIDHWRKMIASLEEGKLEEAIEAS